jgi:hypothetical protein
MYFVLFVREIEFVVSFNKGLYREINNVAEVTKSVESL